MSWFIIVEWAARAILLLLVILSVWSVSIMLERKKFFEFLRNSQGSLDDPKTLGTRDPRYVFFEYLDGQRPTTIPHLHSMYLSKHLHEWSKGLPVLGSLGAITPFIGLLGTILGIIVAFGELSAGQAKMDNVMFALAEALVLTAVGLGVAIPAVIAFNYFNRQLARLQKDLSYVKESFLAKAQS